MDHLSLPNDSPIIIHDTAHEITLSKLRSRKSKEKFLIENKSDKTKQLVKTSCLKVMNGKIIFRSSLSKIRRYAWLYTRHQVDLGNNASHHPD